MFKISKYVLYDILRNKVVLAYTAFLLVISISLFQMEENSSKAMLSMLNIVLIVVPLISIVFATIHFYNSYEFIEMMLAQPIDRKVIFLAEYFAVAMSLSVAFLLGVGIPSLLFGAGTSTFTLLFCGTILSIVFTSLAFLSSVLTRDKAKAIGIALLFWFYFSLIYDGLLLWIIYSFSDYPLEKVTLSLIAFNPVDLARIIMLLKLDISALMGYTGAFYKDFLGNWTGTLFSVGVLALWATVPIAIALQIFRKKDL